MRAWLQVAFGGPEVRRLTELPDPQPGPGEVVVDVLACGLNRLDILQRKAPVIPVFALPHIAGMDIVGTVAEIGEGVDAGLLGRHVALDPVVVCQTCDMCVAGKTYYCRGLRTAGSTRHGGFAEKVLMPAVNCIPIDPSTLSLAEYASIPVASVTAWHGLVGVARLQPGETVVVPAAGSGVGSAGIQVAKNAGCTVITTVGSAAKVDRAYQTGADVVIDRSATDWVQAARAATGGKGVDVVFDHVGGPFLQEAIDALRIEGRVVMSGTTASDHSTIRSTSLFHWGKNILAHGGYSPAEMREVIGEYERGALKPVIDSVHSFDELDQAEARLESGEFSGKVVVCRQ